MPRVTTYNDALPFIAQPESLIYDMGRDIDWANTGSATTVAGGTTMVVLASGKICPYATKPGAETAYGILLAGADQSDRTGQQGHGLIVGGNLFENLVTSFTDADWATQKSDLGAAFIWQTYGDDRVV